LFGSRVYPHAVGGVRIAEPRRVFSMSPSGQASRDACDTRRKLLHFDAELSRALKRLIV